MSTFYKEYDLKNGKRLTIRNPEPDDAMRIIEMISTMDTETEFMAREPGEFNYTEERERQLLTEFKADENCLMICAEIDGKIVGTCDSRINSRARYRHRSSMAIGILKEYWGMGIGRLMMENGIEWSRAKGVTQIELGVDTQNERAIALYKSVGLEIQCTVRRDRRMSDGSYRDEYRMAMYLDEEI